MNFVYDLHHVHSEYIDTIKGLGVYSSELEARKAIEGYKKLPGFKDYPDGFVITECELNKGLWANMN